MEHGNSSGGEQAGQAGRACHAAGGCGGRGLWILKTRGQTWDFRKGQTWDFRKEKEWENDDVPCCKSVGN